MGSSPASPRAIGRLKKFPRRQVARLSYDALKAGGHSRGANGPVWGDVDAKTGEELWWLLPSGLNELDRLDTGERP